MERLLVVRRGVLVRLVKVTDCNMVCALCAVFGAMDNAAIPLESVVTWILRWERSKLGSRLSYKCMVIWCSGLSRDRCRCLAKKAPCGDILLHFRLLWCLFSHHVVQVVASMSYQTDRNADCYLKGAVPSFRLTAEDLDRLVFRKVSHDFRLDCYSHGVGSFPSSTLCWFLWLLHLLGSCWLRNGQCGYRSRSASVQGVPDAELTRQQDSPKC
jgi:hypothetical protein